ncbi:flagellar hook-length control protein FliK [Megalodesulfovibrio gigas]|uniref:Putative Flagellar hook-length control protein-like protein n=1 Tax=Megalodesulfovibrio gigas (strain ATCC 19364 / DSM 1382 / NCIMB 9332 / VKM B-1759) TaxID=1121448 RepID=T2G842_MEGG1|nr:flagellar hook-length control protein FliK [Megalodesulfovibrio gigas]AGW12047.1 putative Flagellar hook-length control protein-like protein [Megalodesulfovibrio gigas DSM 1382 = ATCC 19364]
MQIIPLSKQLQQQTESLSNNLATGLATGQDFSSILSELEESSTTASTSSSTTASQVQGQSAYDMDRANASTLQVSAEDFAALTEDLFNAGLSKSDIRDLQTLVESDSGLSWQDLMQQVNQKLDAKDTEGAGKASLTDEELRALHGFFQKIGFNPTEAKDLLSQFSNGQGDAAWLQIQAKLAGMSDSKTVSMRFGELAALAKLTGLDPAIANNFAGLFNANGEARLGRSGLQAITLTLRQTAAATHGALAQQLRDPARQILNDKLKSALNQALDEAQRDSLASNKESRDVQSQRFRIKEAAAQNHRQSGEAAASRSSGETMDPHALKASIAQASKKETADPADADELVKTDAKADIKADVKAVDPASKDALANALASKKVAGSDGSGHGSTGKDSSQGQAFSQKEQLWRDMWSKVETEPAGRKSVRIDPLLAAARVQEALTVTQQQAKAAKGDAVFQRAAVQSEKVLQAVEQGALRSLAEGSKQLTLRLDSPDLGKVTVILQVSSNKEVTASLRPDNQEAAAALSQQLTQLKQSLEQQGLKVEKLDVQTNLAQDQNAANWQGSGQHNFSQEQGARMAEQRAWGFLRRAAAQDAALAREMQNGAAGEVSSRVASLNGAGAAAGINIIA